MVNVKIDAPTRRAIAVKHLLDPKQIARFLKGEAQKPLTAARVKAALQAEGVLPADSKEAA